MILDYKNPVRNALSAVEGEVHSLPRAIVAIQALGRLAAESTHGLDVEDCLALYEVARCLTDMAEAIEKGWQVAWIAAGGSAPQT